MQDALVRRGYAMSEADLHELTSAATEPLWRLPLVAAASLPLTAHRKVMEDVRDAVAATYRNATGEEIAPAVALALAEDAVSAFNREALASALRMG